LPTSPPIPFFFSLTPPPPTSTLFPYTTLFRSRPSPGAAGCAPLRHQPRHGVLHGERPRRHRGARSARGFRDRTAPGARGGRPSPARAAASAQSGRVSARVRVRRICRAGHAAPRRPVADQRRRSPPRGGLTRASGRLGPAGRRPVQLRPLDVSLPVSPGPAAGDPAAVPPSGGAPRVSPGPDRATPRALRHRGAGALCEPDHLAGPGTGAGARGVGISRARRSRALVPSAGPVL